MSAQGQAVEFFHETDPADINGLYLLREGRSAGPVLLQSHGWLQGALEAGTLCEAASAFNRSDVSTWPVVIPNQNILVTDRSDQRRTSPLRPQRLPLNRIRAPSQRPPALSLVFLRWGGKHKVSKGRANDWGELGCPPCDNYMSAVVSTGLLCHPRVGTQEACNSDGVPLDFDVFSIFVRDSVDTRGIVELAPCLAASMQGQKKASFWMLWPAEWEDTGDALYAGYVDRSAFFAAMRACESAGIRSSFPHPADLYELITSKEWMVTLSSHPEACLPAAVSVSKENFLCDQQETAAQALDALNVAWSQKALSASLGHPAALADVNRHGVKKGVVKVGWSWEGQFVYDFLGVELLAVRLQEMLACEGFLGSSCIVQEWVEFDFEMRLFFFPPHDWTPAKVLLPQRIEYNTWGAWDKEEGKPGYFHHASREKCLALWDNDEDALGFAVEKAVNISQYLLAWLFKARPEPVPMLRLDFMLRYLDRGRALVVFGEFCEMGACCLTWEDGPPMVWRAALDYALR